MCAIHPMDAEDLICQIPSSKITIWIHQKFMHLKLQSFEWHTKIWGCQREYMKRFCVCQKKTIWHLLNGRVDLKGLGELLIRTKQKYLWIQLDQNKFAKNFGSICNNNRCKGEAKNIANYFISIVLIFKLQWQQGEAEIESD